MNFKILSQKIENATKKAFIEMFEKNGAEEIYGFALYSDHDGETVCPSTNTVKFLSSIDQEDLAYYKFEPAEWKYEGEGANEDFDEIYHLLEQIREESGIDDNVFLNDMPFLRYRDNVFNTCIDVLEKLKNENFFKQITGKDIFLLFSVSDFYSKTDTEVQESIVTQLNDNAYRSEYLEWLKDRNSV